MSDRMLRTLEQIEAAIWDQLGRAGADTEHQWRTPVLATVGVDATGAAVADARTVVLREVDADARQLVFYTDSRAQKVGQLAAQPAATLLLWSKRLSWQLRCTLVCRVEDSGLAVSSHWARIKLSRSAQDYLSPLPPGSPLDAQAPALAKREYFALVSAQVSAIDWLEIGRSGHRRARFESGQANWLQP